MSLSFFSCFPREKNSCELKNIFFRAQKKNLKKRMPAHKSKGKAIAVYCADCSKYIPCHYTSDRFIKYICPHNKKEQYLATVAKRTDVKWEKQKKDEVVVVNNNEEEDSGEYAVTYYDSEDTDSDDLQEIDTSEFKENWTKLERRYDELTEERKTIKKQKTELLQKFVDPLEKFTGYKIKISKKSLSPSFVNDHNSKE
jgi:hypothetical protein